MLDAVFPGYVQGTAEHLPVVGAGNKKRREDRQNDPYILLYLLTTVSIHFYIPSTYLEVLSCIFQVRQNSIWDGDNAREVHRKNGIADIV